MQLYFKQQGASQEATYYALAIFNAGSFLGRVLPNLVADQLCAGVFPSGLDIGKTDFRLFLQLWTVQHASAVLPVLRSHDLPHGAPLSQRPDTSATGADLLFLTSES